LQYKYAFCIICINHGKGNVTNVGMVDVTMALAFATLDGKVLLATSMITPPSTYIIRFSLPPSELVPVEVATYVTMGVIIVTPVFTHCCCVLLKSGWNLFLVYHLNKIRALWQHVNFLTIC
jgi:hypothetical protein